MAKIITSLSNSLGTIHNNLEGLNESNFIHLTQIEKNKFDNIQNGAEVNVNADWNSISGDSEILNKPLSFPPSSHNHNVSNISGTKSEFNTSLTDGNFLFDGDIVPFNPLDYDLNNFTNISTDPFARVSELTSDITNLSYTPSAINGIINSDTGTDATIPTVDFTNAGLLTPSEKQLLYNNSATGITKFDGFSINVDTTKYDTGIIEGWFVDNTTNPNAPTKVLKSFPATTANTLTNIATQNVTYIAVDINGVHQQSGVPFEPEVQRDWIPLGVIVHSNRVSINAINNQPVVAISPNNQLSDLMESIGVFNITGNVFSPNGVNLSINKSAGQIFKQGSNFITNTKDPHTTLLPALIAPSNIRYRTQLGAESANTNVIAPNFWDNAGVVTAMTGTRWSIQRIYVFQSNLIRIQYGQATYANLADAIQSIPTEPFVVEQNILENGLFRGLLIVRNTTVDLTNPARALFIEASKFGSVAGLGSLSTSNLQQAYNNSLTPEITTDSILGAFTLKRGSTLDTDNIFEGQNGAGVNTFSITGNGALTALTYNGYTPANDLDVIHKTGNETKIGTLSLITPNIGAGTSGLNAVTPIIVTGGNGGSNTNTTGTVQAGNAANINIKSGNGGGVTSVTGTGISGNGGNITILAGNGGVATGTGTLLKGNGGNAILQGGLSYGVPGTAEVKAGNNISTAGIGASVFLTAGWGNDNPADNNLYNGSIFSGVSSAGVVRGNTVVGNVTDDRIHRFQVTGNSIFNGTVTTSGSFINSTAPATNILLADGSTIAQSSITTDISGKENISNKQNSLAVDGTGVKYATVDAVNSGLAIKAIDEGNGIGYVIANRNPLNYGPVGLGSVDLSISDSASSVYGATGTSSFASGNQPIASGYGAFATGYITTASGYASTAIGARSIASGNYSTASGVNSIASGLSSYASGDSVYSKSLSESALGAFNSIYTPISATTFEPLDRIFGVGNGTTNLLRSDALIILKNGLTTLPSVTNALITSEPTGKAVVTKEYLINAPISTATQTALNLKANLAGPTFTGVVIAPTIAVNSASTNNLSVGSGTVTFAGVVSGVDGTAPTHLVTKSQLDLKANLASPTFTGVPIAPTATAGNNTTQIATTAFVTSADADNVKLAGLQVIAGVKQFSDYIQFRTDTGITSGGSFPIISRSGNHISIASASVSGLARLNTQSISTGSPKTFTFQNQDGTFALTNNPTSLTATSFINSTAPATNALLANGTTLANPISGTGTTGYIQKTTSTGVLGDSNFFDAGPQSQIRAGQLYIGNPNTTNTNNIYIEIGSTTTAPNIQGAKAGVSTAPLHLQRDGGNVIVNGGIDNGVDKLQVSGSVLATQYKKTGGLISQNLLADGSVFDKYNNSISTSTYFQNITLDPTIIEGMTATPPLAGTYKVDFNGQFNTALANVTQQAVVDLNALYLNLNGQTVTNTVFPTFGAGTTILPGVYSTSVAVNATGAITLNGQGNPNSIFIFKMGAAITVAAGCTFNLTNGATSNNVFFISEGIVAIGANSNISGTIISPVSAIGIGSGATLNGRAFCQSSAVTNGGNVYVPVLTSPFPMGVMNNFALFTALGNVVNNGVNIIVGDVGTNNGAVTGFETATLSGYIYLPAQGASNCKFSIYVNGTEITTSTRERTNVITKDDVILSDTVTITAGQTISIKNTNSIGISRFYNRNLTITKI